MKNLKRNLCALMIVTLSISMMTGCKKKEGLTTDELSTMVNGLSAENKKKDKEITALKEVLATYNPKLSEIDGLQDYFTLATGEEAYLSMRDRINVLNPIQLKPSNQIQNQTILNLTNDIRFSPNANWTLQASSGMMKMNHANGVYGEIEAYEYIGSSTAIDCYDNIIKPHLDAIHAEQLGDKSNIFLADGTRAGYQVTSRLKVAHLKDDTNHIFTEDMTKPYEEELPVETDEEGNVIESTSDGEESTAENLESTEGAEESSTESSADSSGGENEAVEEGQVAPENEEESLSSGESTGERVTQLQDNVDSVDNYLYTCGVAMYSADGIKKYTVVFKFFYKEGDAVDVTSKMEFVDNTIKSLAIQGNYLRLQ